MVDDGLGHKAYQMKFGREANLLSLPIRQSTVRFHQSNAAFFHSAAEATLKTISFSKEPGSVS
jgi:hypothetical protein